MPRGKANDCYMHLIPSIVGNGSHWFPANINHPESLIYQPNKEIPAKDGPVRSENLAKIPAKDGSVRLDKDFIKSMEKYLDGVVESLGEDRGRRKGLGKSGGSSKRGGKTKSISAVKGKDAEAVRESENEVHKRGPGETLRSSDRKGARGTDGDEEVKTKKIKK